MARRVPTSGKATRQGRSKSAKSRAASSRARKRSPRDLELQKQLAEALQQKAASGEVLKIISSSPGDMKPVFEAMLVNALRLCGAEFGHILFYDGERFGAAHLHDVPPAYRKFWEKHGPITPDPNTALGRLVRTKQIVHIPDLKAEPAYAERQPLRVVTVEQAGARSFLGVPMLKQNALVGAIIIYRQQVRPFTERQIELVKNFADQAVIAIENARLFNETKDALERQTATADILKVIASSPSDVQPVFEAIAESAARLCQAEFCNVFRFDGELIHFMHSYGYSREAIEALRHFYPMRPGRGSCAGRAILNGKVEQVPDIRADREYAQGNVPDMMKVSSIVAVPMVKERRPVGAIALVRAAKGTFPQRQIDLLKTFADQAVIAIENARLFEEVQAKTRDLEESLQQQTS